MTRPSSPSSSASSSTSKTIPSRDLTGVSLLPHLRLASHASALVFSTFLIVHLASPIAAALHTGTRLLTGNGCDGSVEGSVDAANGYLLLGRVWYRPGGEDAAAGRKVGWTESVVVWGSLAVHVGCGVVKRAILLGGEVRRRRRRRGGVVKEGRRGDEEEQVGREEKVWQEHDQSKALDGDADKNKEESKAAASTSPSSSTTPPTSSNLPTPSFLHALTGQALLLPLGAHVLLTRLGSATRSLAKDGGGVEIDHSLVAHGLVNSEGKTRGYAAMSWAVLVGTTVLSAWHVAGGTHLIGQRLAARRKAQRRRRGKAAGATLRDEGPSRPPPSRAQQLARTANPAILGSIAVLAGVGCIAGDYAGGAGLAVGPCARKRFDVVYRGTWPWSLVRRC